MLVTDYCTYVELEGAVPVFIAPLQQALRVLLELSVGERRSGLVQDGLELFDVDVTITIFIVLLKGDLGCPHSLQLVTVCLLGTATTQAGHANMGEVPPRT